MGPGTYRQIHTLIWKDQWFLALPPDGKLLFIYLFSNESTSVAGIYKIAPEVIAFETKLGALTVKRYLDQFLKDGKIAYEDGIMWVINLRKYNANPSPKVQRRIDLDVAAIQDCPIKRAYIAFYCGHQIPYRYGIDTHAATPDTVSIHGEQEREQETERETTFGAFAPTDLPVAAAAGKAAREPTKQQAMLEAICNASQLDIVLAPKGRVGKVAAALVKARYTPEQVAHAYGTTGWWYREDWRGKQGQPPTPEQIAETIKRATQATSQATILGAAYMVPTIGESK